MKIELVKTKNAYIVIWIVFLTYLALLIKVILFKYPIHMIIGILKSREILPLSFRIANSNFVPLKTILNYLFGNHSFKIVITNILGNIITFIPLGFLLPIIFKAIKKLKHIVLSTFILSSLLEIIQLLTALGNFDIDDILMNVYGSICGYIFYRGFTYLILMKKSN